MTDTVPQIPLSPPTSSSQLVLLKDGAGITPIFVAHGLGGSATQLLPVVQQFRLPNPVFGVRQNETLDRIEDMARVYADAIRQKEPHGPYFLIGYSLGGLMVLEMARQLASQGKRVGLAIMVDSYPHLNRLPFRQQVRLIARRTAGYVNTTLESVTINRAAHKRKQSSVSPTADLAWRNAARALKRYTPRYYDGRVTFIRAQNGTYFPSDPAAVWAKTVAEIKVETVPGDHIGIVTTHAAGLASVLTGQLKAAGCAV